MKQLIPSRSFSLLLGSAVVLAVWLLCTSSASRSASVLHSGGGDAVRGASVAPAIAAYRDGSYELALRLLTAEAERDRAQQRAPLPEVLLNAGLCSLRLLRSRDAEQWVAPLAGGGDDAVEQDAADRDADWRPEAAFLLGLASCQHAERAVTAARLVDAEPMAWAMATRAVQAAELQFRRACELRPDWPEAVRNLERVQRRRQEIAAERDASKSPDAKKEDAPEPPPPTEQPPPEPESEVVVPAMANAPLQPQQLKQLRRRLQERQQKKLSGRQQQARSNAAAGTRDW